jgi:hypothetical protein
MKKKQIYEAVYKGRQGNRAVITNVFDEMPLDVTIPYGAIENLELKEGDKFRYAMGRDHKIDPSSLELVKPQPWSEKEKKEIAKFIQKAVQIDKDHRTRDSSTKIDTIINSSRAEVYFHKDCPLLDNKWDYAVIVQVEDDEKTARVDLMKNDGREIASLTSCIYGPISHVQTARINGELTDTDPLELVDKLKKYLPKKFKEWQEC